MFKVDKKPKTFTGTFNNKNLTSRNSKRSIYDNLSPSQSTLLTGDSHRSS
jgi:hypothetical protein